jgi:UDP-N-acetylmuramoylalanine-D-glutamate ligase
MTSTVIPSIPSAIEQRGRPPVPHGPYAVAGLRRAGLAAVDALCRHATPAEVVAYERFAPGLRRRDRRRLGAAGVRIRVGDEADELVSSPRPGALIKSPGISFDAPLIRAAERLSIPVLDELELGWRLSAAPIVGITGTNGKTTVATLAADVLAGGGLTVALAGNTNAGPPLSAVGRDADLIVCEVSSFQLEGCPELMPEVAVFTNLSQDHLSRHHTMRRYGEFKRRLFVRGDLLVPVAIVDVGDRFGRGLADELQSRGGQVIRIGVDARAAYRVRDVRWDLRSAVVALATPSGELTLSTQLPGWHNARNVAAAVALGDLFGIDRRRLDEIVVAHVGPPARLEGLQFGQDPSLLLDIAGSPASVAQVLRTVRATMTPGQHLHVVLGLLGSPDEAHLRAVGGAAAGLADRLWVTSGSLRPQPPTQAIGGLVAGARAATTASVQVVVRRRDAMRAALAAAGRDDVVIVLGRGDVSEPVHDRRLDDRGALRELVSCGSC